MDTIAAQDTRVVACLPFVHLRPNEEVSIGPISFWSGSRAQEFVPESQWPQFEAYLEKVGCIRSRETGQFREQDTPREALTFVSVHRSIIREELSECLVDGISLFYYTCYHRDLYENVQVPPFQTFTKLLPAGEDFFQNVPKVFEDQTHQPACIGNVDARMARALGHCMSSVYLADLEDLARRRAYARRVLRAIRYFVSGFSAPFENLWNQGFEFPQRLFEPEDVIFLTSAFESLLNIESDQNTSDFKYRTRGIVQLEYSTAMEVFWAWTDGFFSLKYDMVYHGEHPETLFRGNPNFEVSYLYLGIRLFIFILHHKLCLHGFFPKAEGRHPELEPLGRIHREEVMVFFWPEKELLDTVALNLERWTIPEAYQEFREVTLFHMNLFLTIYKRYYQPKTTPAHSAVRFFPTPKPLLEPSVHNLLAMRHQDVETDQGTMPLQALTPEDFWSALKGRLED